MKKLFKEITYPDGTKKIINKVGDWIDPNTGEVGDTKSLDWEKFNKLWEKCFGIYWEGEKKLFKKLFSNELAQLVMENHVKGMIEKRIPREKNPMFFKAEGQTTITMNDRFAEGWNNCIEELRQALDIGRKEEK